MFNIQLNGLRAWVSIDNVALDHYNVEFTPDGRSVACWIPSETGQHFAVNWTDTMYNRPGPTAGWVMVDGADVGSKFITPNDRFAIASVAGIISSQTTFRPFIFWPPELTDDGAYLHGTPGQIPGEIALEIWSVTLGTPHYAQGEPVPHPMKVHDQFKGDVVHCTRFGPEIYTPPTTSYSPRKIAHLATFIFKYRPLDMLRANGIAPCELRVRAGEKRRAAHAPDSQSSDSVDGEDTDEELRALQKKLDALRAKVAKARGGPKRLKSVPVRYEKSDGN